MVNVQAVVVAYNRRDLLKDALDALSVQTRALETIHVVDNASDDGTSEMVGATFPHATLHTMPSNTGGAGGFAAGLAYALESEADLVWLMDDDTVPSPTALEALLEAREAYSGPPPAAMASRVVWTDGRDHPMNTPRPRPGVSRSDLARAASVGCVPVRSASFVSLLVAADSVREVGLPEADFFLWNDDFEFSTRLLRHEVGLYCPASVVEHRTKTFGSTDIDPGERFYYEVRNKVWTFTRSDGLAPKEKILYGGSTVRRWARTFAASGRRGVLLTGLRRGLADGLRQGPRDCHQVMREAGSSIPEVAPRGQGRA